MVQNKTYNDGIVKIYKETNDLKNTNFNEKKNIKRIDDMEFIISLAFKEMSKRSQDLEFAEENGHSLSIKIKTRLVDIVKENYKAIYNGYLYDIYSIDIDKQEKELYLYLEEVRKIAQ